MILGANTLAVPAIKEIRDAGFHVIAVDANPNAEGLRFADESVVADIRDCESICALALDRDVDGILPMNDFAVRAAFWTNQKIGLAGPKLNEGVFGTSKSVMRRVCKEWGVKQPAFVSFSKNQIFDTSSIGFDFPLVVKPSFSGGGGRGVSILEREEEMSQALAEAFEATLDGEVMVESFLPGVELTADFFVHEQQIKSLLLGQKVRSEEARHVATELSFPASLSPEELEGVKLTLQQIVEASGVELGMMHVELIIDPQTAEASLVELGVRGGGGHLFTSIMKAVNGISAPVTLAEIYTGTFQNVRPTNSGGACYRFIAPLDSGNVVGIYANVNEAQRGSVEYGLLNPQGKKFNGLRDSLDRVGYILTSGVDRLKAVQLADEIESIIEFEFSDGSP